MLAAVALLCSFQCSRGSETLDVVLEANTESIAADGKAQVSFYTNDSGADMRVEVEGRSGEKQYHYVEKVIKGKK